MPNLTNVTATYMVTISVFCNLKEPLLVRFIIIAHTVINHNTGCFKSSFRFFIRLNFTNY